MTLSPEDIKRISPLDKAFGMGYHVAHIHSYTSATGEEVYWRVRLEHPTEGKQIRPVHRTASGAFMVGEPESIKDGSYKPLYALHLLTQHTAAHVWVVEGEKCADTLNACFEKAGVQAEHVATTSGSASSADKADWLPLAGRAVTIWPDNDASGFMYAEKVSACLSALKCGATRIAADAIGLAESEDCVDWLDGHPEVSLADLLSLPIHEVSSPLLPHIDAASEMQRLASLPALEYDKVRETEAKRIGVRVGTLDKEVGAARKQSKAMDDLFSIVEPWPHPVDLAELLDEILLTIRRFIVCDEETAIAAALWCAFTWVIDYVQVAPLAVITAPEKRCGKSQLLDVLGRLSCKPIVASNISPSATFRVIEAYAPTLLIDEADTFFKENEELRGVINSGHTRSSAYTIRNVGEAHQPTRFSTWGAKAISGIGSLADTIMDRAIMLRLRRKLPHETVERLRHADPSVFGELAAKLARFALDDADPIRRARPSLPNALNDREQDNWEPLLAIADCADGSWPDRARAAALALSGSEMESVSPSAELLADIQAVFEMKGVAKVSTVDLLKELCEDEEKSWGTYNRGKPMTPRQLAKRLKEYKIGAKTVRIGYDTPRGFELEQFEDVFARYLAPPVTASATAPQTADSLVEAVADAEACCET